jgi:tRNA A37 threonylcarbamoyladenosine synthetase subunit TsaC/SUA5/YrdC
MAVLDIREDAHRAFAAIRSGGIAILPLDVGYSIIGGSSSSLKRIFETKQRSKSKLNAMLGNIELHREVHAIDRRAKMVVEAITVDYDLPLGVIAPCRLDHPLLKRVPPDVLEGSSRGGTVAMLLNAGRFHEEICRLSRAAEFPLFGSSANLSLAGTKFRCEDIEPEIRSIADVVIDYGLRKYHPWRASSTLLDVERLSVVRWGACFEMIQDILKRHFDVELPMPATGL